MLNQLQYIPHRMRSRGADRFSIIVSIGIAWAFAEILTVAGAYNKRSPRTQLSCRTDRSGLISAARWSVLITCLYHKSHVVLSKPYIIFYDIIGDDI